MCRILWRKQAITWMWLPARAYVRNNVFSVLRYAGHVDANLLTSGFFYRLINSFVSFKDPYGNSVSNCAILRNRDTAEQRANSVSHIKWRNINYKFKKKSLKKLGFISNCHLLSLDDVSFSSEGCKVNFCTKTLDRQLWVKRVHIQ